MDWVGKIPHGSLYHHFYHLQVQDFLRHLPDKEVNHTTLNFNLITFKIIEQINNFKLIIISQTVIKTTLYSLKEISRTSFNFSNIFAALTRFPFSNDPWFCRKALLHCPEINKPKYSTLLILAACKSSVAKRYMREQIQTSVVQLFDGNFVLLLWLNKLAHSPTVDGLAQSSLSVLFKLYT